MPGTKILSKLFVEATLLSFLTVFSDLFRSFIVCVDGADSIADVNCSATASRATTALSGHRSHYSWR